MELPPDDCVDCLKGVINNDPVFVDKEELDYSLFSDAKPVTELAGWNGSSVNWDLPNGEALQELMNRRKNGRLQFRTGVVRIPRSEIDKVVRRYGDNNLAYEIRSENGNDYHGHILFSQALPPRQKTTICAILVYAISEFHKQEQQDG